MNNSSFGVMDLATYKFRGLSGTVTVTSYRTAEPWINTTWDNLCRVYVGIPFWNSKHVTRNGCNLICPIKSRLFHDSDFLTLNFKFRRLCTVC